MPTRWAWPTRTEITMQHLPLIEVALVGLGVGAGSALTGLGAGLSVPLLTCLGLPLPAALLAAKLPVAASDVAAAMGLATGGSAPLQAGPEPALDKPALWLTGLAGAASAAALLCWTPLLALGLSGLLLLLALACAWGGVAPRWQSVCWGGYIGGCGVGAGVMMRATQLQQGAPWWWLSLQARRVGAAANAGAVLVLACGGLTLEPRLWCLALCQGLGAWCASTALAAWRRTRHNSVIRVPQNPR
jgi:hypothetical protein